MVADVSTATEVSTDFGPVRPDLLGTTVVIALSTAVFVALHWRGIPLSPDGWAYWQAAVSLANGSGYRDFSGAPLTAWPPLYSLYLSQCVRLLGPTGLALVIANGALVVGQAALWFHTVCVVWGVGRNNGRRMLILAVALYIALYVPLTFQAAHAANLGLLCAAMMLLATWRAAQARSRRRLWQWTLLATAGGTLALLSHNANLAFVIGCAAALVLIRHRSSRHLAIAASLFVVPVAIWSVVRWQLEQLGSHPLGIGVAAFNSMQYLHQMLLVVGNLIVPNPYGAAVVVGIAIFVGCAWLIWSPRGAAPRLESQRFVAGLVLFASATLWLLFNVTSVTDPIGARFVGWMPLLVVPAMLCSVARVGVGALVAASCLFLAPNVHRLSVFAAIHADLRPQKEIGVLFPIGALISPTYTSGPLVETNRGLLIAPPR